MAPLTIGNGWLDLFWEPQVQNVSNQNSLKTLKLKAKPNHKIV